MFTDFVNDKYVIAMLAIFVSIYSSMGEVKLPPFINDLFKNDIFRVVFLSLLLIYGAKYDNTSFTPHVSLIIALIFVITMYYINQQEKYENFTYFEIFKKNLNHI